MNVRLAAELYQSGLTLREVSRILNRTEPAVYLALRDAGIPRRSWDPWTCGAKYRPRVEVTCARCGRSFKRREFYYVHGCGITTAPNPPKTRYCSLACQSHGQRRLALERARHTTTIDIRYS
jgi:hypothetical protein